MPPAENHNQSQPPSSIKLEDIYFVLFRHKWKIVCFSAIGLVAAACLYFLKPAVYQSEAKLYLPYITERKSLAPVNTDSQIQSSDSRGENIINSELEILDSLDLAAQVAEAITPEKVLANAGGGNSKTAAAFVIKKSLQVDVGKKSSVIHLVFQNRDASLVQPVLQKYVELYPKKHSEVHRGLGFADEFITQQKENYKRKIAEVENQLWAYQSNGLVSAEDFKAFSERRMKILEELSLAQANYEEKKSVLPSATPSTKTNNAAPLDVKLPPEKVKAYRDLCGELTSFSTNLSTLRLKLTITNETLQRLQTEVTRLELAKKKMEEETPQLTSIDVAVAPTGGQGTAESGSIYAQLKALEAKMRVYSEQLDQIRTQELAFAKAQSTISQLQREKELDEANYKYYLSSYEQAQIDDALGSGKYSNIKVVQEPSPAAKDNSKVLKPVAATAAGGILGGLALAFLFEFVLNQTIKRPGEIKTKLHWTVFQVLPDTSPNGGYHWPKFLATAKSKLLPWKKKRHLLASPQTSDVRPPSSELAALGSESLSALNSQLSTAAIIAPWDAHHSLHPYYEQLRDRLVLYFESRNLLHKPKLVSVTSCAKGSGVSTIATGLAASLSETGDGNVLLVDMNSENGAAHPFYNGKPGCGLPDVLEKEKREPALIQENLYMVKGHEGDGDLPRLVPKKLTDLMPRIKASDYDYIIFDMPPITQTGVVLRLAGHMDMVLMVVEFEKTNRGLAHRAASLLDEAKANVAAVLNKRREYIPAWLHSEA
ncbi:MAG TPA: Wzz/FepE/Etk N-terminal domain-containing protein [Verrucomicrobiae bacterium]